MLEIKTQQYLNLRNTFVDFYGKTYTLSEVAALPEGASAVATAGRVTRLRVMGKLLFAALYDFTATVQICVKHDPDHPQFFQQFVETVSLGDFVGVTGELFVTKTGELTLRAQSYELLNKALRPLPEKYHGLENIESRYRQRYLDLIANEQSRDVFRKRFTMIKSLRRYLEDDGYIEVETPILQTVPSGALARPFFTRHNALDISCVLRIACETYLKRMIGAGLDKVFEFARCFRNEGVSATHLQDFTMLEFYAAYQNANHMRGFVEKLLKHVIKQAFDSDCVTLKNGCSIDCSKPWPVKNFVELIQQYADIDLTQTKSIPLLIQAIENKRIPMDDAQWRNMSFANIADALYKKVCRPHLIEPCFVEHYPVDMAPLARRHSGNPDYVDFFQFVIDGVELVKAYSELVDPIDQRQRFVDQMQARQAGDDEAMPLDEDFLLAMEHGFPPVCGVGIGIDRLTMLLCGCDNIKDTVLFPLLRPH